VRVDEQIDTFQFRVESIIDYFESEFDIPYHAVIGVLEEVKKDYLEKSNEMIFEIEDENENENEDEDDGEINYA
jgi:hypothetical protein